MGTPEAESGLRGQEQEIRLSNIEGAQKQSLDCIINLGVVSPEMCHQCVCLQTPPPLSAKKDRISSNTQIFLSSRNIPDRSAHTGPALSMPMCLLLPPQWGQRTQMCPSRQVSTTSDFSVTRLRLPPAPDPWRAESEVSVFHQWENCFNALLASLHLGKWSDLLAWKFGKKGNARPIFTYLLGSELPTGNTNLAAPPEAGFSPMPWSSTACDRERNSA